jgi:hypothetical protein
MPQLLQFNCHDDNFSMLYCTEQEQNFSLCSTTPLNFDVRTGNFCTTLRTNSALEYNVFSDFCAHQLESDGLIGSSTSIPVLSSLSGCWLLHPCGIQKFMATILRFLFVQHMVGR